MSTDEDRTVVVDVRHGFLISHEGRSYTAADGPVEVPASLASEWIRKCYAYPTLSSPGVYR